MIIFIFHFDSSYTVLYFKYIVVVNELMFNFIGDCKMGDRANIKFIEDDGGVI